MINQDRLGTNVNVNGRLLKKRGVAFHAAGAELHGEHPVGRQRPEMDGVYRGLLDRCSIFI